MSDEIQQFTDARPSAPPYPERARRAARDRLLDEAAGRRRSWRPRLRPGWQAVGAFALTVTMVGGVAVALSSWSQRSGPAAGAGAGTPGTADPASAATESVAVAPPVQGAELNPRPGQYIAVESETMYTSESFGAAGITGRYLYRTHRKIWKSVDGNAAGLLWIEGRAPKKFPGWPLPAEAENWKGGGWNEIAGHCPSWPDDTRTDYAYLSKLPADPAAMRAYLYRTRGGDNPDQQAFTTLGDTFLENYLPRAQRQALFEAAKTIPGVEEKAGVKDSAGREGVALGRVSRGILEQRIFDPETFMFLGERGTVVDAKIAEAPAGSVLALTAQLKVSVVDALPEAKDASKDGSCEMTAEPASPSADPSPADPTPTTSGAS
ncbi:CU044_5270 family protein [Sphaerisporangium album]|uniref:CU044_5270 family protein n=1 Tax=Sphaerisporangium album TaxID=509200 RepID=UPI0015F0F33D|nr:CU044_5270 family protein [Sphaerisporangium album]